MVPHGVKKIPLQSGTDKLEGIRLCCGREVMTQREAGRLSSWDEGFVGKEKSERMAKWSTLCPGFPFQEVSSERGA